MTDTTASVVAAVLGVVGRIWRALAALIPTHFTGSPIVTELHVALATLATGGSRAIPALESIAAELESLVKRGEAFAQADYDRLTSLLKATLTAHSAARPAATAPVQGQTDAASEAAPAPAGAVGTTAKD